MIVTGRVSQVVERGTKFGSYYDIVVDGRKYGHGKKKPAFSDGDYVTFEAEAKGDFFNADPSSFKKVQVATEAAPSAVAAAVSTSGKKWIPEVDRQDSITYQSARKDALQLTQILIEAGKMDFGKMKGAEAIDMVEMYVDNYTQRFFKDTKNLKHVPEEKNTDATPEEIADL